MSALRTHAIVLRRTNYGEADRILHLLTPQGRRSVIARGVRREKSKLAGGIELFAVTDIVINEGRGELGILTAARLVRFYGRIVQDYERLQFGYGAVKQVSSATETIDETEWFDTLLEVFEALDSKTTPRLLTEAWFYLRYAALMGHELNLIYDVNSERLQPGRTYMYDVTEKGLRGSPQGNITENHIKFMRLVNTKSLKVLTQVGGIDAILPGCFHVARQHAAI